MNKTIMIAAISVAFVAGTLTAGTLVEATPTSTEPLNNIKAFGLSTTQLQTFLQNAVIKISSDAPFKVDFCGTNGNNSQALAFLSGTFQGIAPIQLNSVPIIFDSRSTQCISFGGNSGDEYSINLQGTSMSAPNTGGGVFFTTQTTPLGTVTVEVCEVGEKGLFNCQQI